MIQVKKLLKQHILSKFVFGTTAIFISGCEQNLDYSQYLTLPEISLPTKLYKLESSTENLPKETGIINFSTYSIVRAKKGERVFQVADRINVSSKELALYNGLSENYKLNQGEILAVPNNAKKANKNKAINIAKVASNAIDRVQTKEETLVEKSTELSEETNDASKTMDTSEEQVSLSEEQTTNKPFLKPIEGEISTPFSYELSYDSYVTITVYDLLGNVVRNLVGEYQNSGLRSVQWDATNDHGHTVAAGVYLYRIESGSFTNTKKMILLK